MFSKSASAIISLALVAAPTLVAAAPLRRQTPAVDPNNVLVLQFAQVLNQLEDNFYQQALQKFQASDIQSAGFTSAQAVVEQLTQIQGDESSHISALQAALQSLGETPLTSCQFDLSSVLTDVQTTATVARLVENVGVGAFLGAADLISDPTILTAAASILTVEARHQTMLNILNNGAPIPNPFDLPLLPQEVLAIAGPFISGCDLGVPANPSLTITNTDSIEVGTQLTFSSSAISGSTDGLFCQLLAGGMPFSIPMPLSQCVVPGSLAGPVAVFVTNDTQPLNNNARDRATTQMVAGPAVMFIDSVPQAFDALLRTSSGNSTTTQTISPDQASSILASATATVAASASATVDNSGVVTASATPAASASAGSSSIVGAGPVFSSIPMASVTAVPS